MSEYRIYLIDQYRHFKQPEILDADSDGDAIAAAKARTNGQTIVIWNGARLVMRLESK